MSKRDEYEDVYDYGIEDNTGYEELGENEDIEETFKYAKFTYLFMKKPNGFYIIRRNFYDAFYQKRT